jgi:protein required for attachment to host cells
MTMLPHDTQILVSDGRKALFFRNRGDEIRPKFETVEALSHDEAPTRELGSDAPGRSFASAGHGRSAVEGPDLHDLSEQRFLKGVAERVNRAVLEGRAKALVIVAPARALAVLRHELSPAAQRAAQAEFHKDLVNLPVAEIEQHVLKMLAERS